jgi:hypothetical protein
MAFHPVMLKAHFCMAVNALPADGDSCAAALAPGLSIQQ